MAFDMRNTFAAARAVSVLHAGGLRVVPADEMCEG
jgi:hypothetical protein